MNGGNVTDTPRLYLAATGHIYNGLCPDDEQPNARDKECPACRLLIEVERGGWKLVPRTPTDAMLRAAQSAWLDDPLRRTTTMWLAMLAAAQQPEVPHG